jgi:hypothetical protein
MTIRRFPPPWSIEDIGARRRFRCERRARGQKLGYNPELFACEAA